MTKTQNTTMRAEIGQRRLPAGARACAYGADDDDAAPLHTKWRILIIQTEAADIELRGQRRSVRTRAVAHEGGRDLG